MNRNGERQRRRGNREPSVLYQFLDRVDADEIEQRCAQIQHAPKHADKHAGKDRLQSQFPGDIEMRPIVGDKAPVLVAAGDQRVRDKEPTERHEKQQRVGHDPRALRSNSNGARQMPYQAAAPSATMTAVVHIANVVQRRLPRPVTATSGAKSAMKRSGANT